MRVPTEDPPVSGTRAEQAAAALDARLDQARREADQRNLRLCRESWSHREALLGAAILTLGAEAEAAGERRERQHAEEIAMLKAQLSEAEAMRDRLRADLARMQGPWWGRLFGARRGHRGGGA